MMGARFIGDNVGRIFDNRTMRNASRYVGGARRADNPRGAGRHWRAPEGMTMQSAQARGRKRLMWGGGIAGGAMLLGRGQSAPGGVSGSSSGTGGLMPHSSGGATML